MYSIARNRMIDSRRRLGRRPEQPVAEQLSPDQRDVLLLRVIRDFSIEEVAKVIGKRTGAVKRLHRRGLAAARKRLKAEEATP